MVSSLCVISTAERPITLKENLPNFSPFPPTLQKIQCHKHSKLLNALPKKNHLENNQEFLSPYHCKRHPINFMFISGFVLSKRRVAFQQLVKHAPKREPIC